VRLLRDYQGVPIRLTDERLTHILEHPEMVGLERAISETLMQAVKVLGSLTDPDAHLYYRLYPATLVGEKYLCVVVKFSREDAFVITAYLTDKIKAGVLLWSKKR
jgi:hypothetical protein